MTAPLLALQGLHAHYDKSHVLQGVSLTVRNGEIVSLLGRNGSGRSTTLKAIMGLVAPTGGSVRLAGKDIAGERAFRIACAGIAFVPEEREIFANITVHENMRIGMQPPRAGAPNWTIEQMYGFFPQLKVRRDTAAGMLSGGEQQMLTMCRALLGNPRVILIDEPTEGLAPKIVEVVTDMIREIRKRGVSVLLVEQKLTVAMRVSDRVYVMGHGQVVFEGTPQALRNAPEVRSNWLEVN
jgi:branched-chain amino acid transport system ATP-binding protein